MAAEAVDASLVGDDCFFVLNPDRLGRTALRAFSAANTVPFTDHRARCKKPVHKFFRNPAQGHRYLSHKIYALILRNGKGLGLRYVSYNIQLLKIAAAQTAVDRAFYHTDLLRVRPNDMAQK